MILFRSSIVESVAENTEKLLANFGTIEAFPITGLFIRQDIHDQAVIKDLDPRFIIINGTRHLAQICILIFPTA